MPNLNELQVLMNSGVARNMSWGVQYNIFVLKALFLLYFLKKILKTPFYLGHSSLGLGMQMPLCTSPGYATDYEDGYKWKLEL